MNAEWISAATPHPNGYRVNDLLVDARMGRVTRGGTELGITGLSFDLLIALIRAAPDSVSIDSLMETVWLGAVVSPETVTQRIKLLRQGLGDSAIRPRYIAVRRGHGYRLVATVKALELEVPAPSDTSSIAVLPFANLTGEPGNDYLGDGMAEEIIHALSTVHGLKVPARTSSFAYKGRDADIRRIARDLGVATVLEGSVRSAGECVRISARLVDAGSNFQIWSHTYERQLADLFKLQDDLAAQIVEELRKYLSTNLQALPERSLPTPDLEAYQLYLQARAVARGTPGSQRAAFDLADQAVRRDPKFARALAYRAFVQVTLVLYGLASLNTLDRAKLDAERALALSADLAEAFAAIAAIAQIRSEWAKAATHLLTGLTATPSDPWLRTLHAVLVLMPTGQLQHALSELSESYRLAPAEAFVIHHRALAYALAGNDADAIRFIELGRKLGGGGPPGWDLLLPYTRAAILSGKYEEVTDRALKTLPATLSNVDGIGVIKVFYKALGDPAERPAASRALESFVPKLAAANVDGGTRAHFVYMFTALNALDQAYELANRCLDQNEQSGNNQVWHSLWSSEMRPFRQDPRFHVLVTRLNFMDYWRRYGPPDTYVLQDNKLMCH